MLKRMSDIIRFIKGDFIMFTIDNQTLVVEAENFERERLREIASTFFKRVYDL